MWCRKSYGDPFPAAARHIHNHLCTPLLQNEPPGLPSRFSHFSRYAYPQWLGMDEQLRKRVNVSLKDTLTGHTAIAEMCPSAYWTERFMAGVTLDNNYYMPIQPSVVMTVVVESSWRHVLNWMLSMHTLGYLSPSMTADNWRTRSKSP